MAPYLITSTADFEKKLKEAGSKLVVIEFYATWCGPCKLMSPVFDQLANEFKSSAVVFLKVDVDENDDLASRYEISCMPTFILMKSGKKVDSMTGANDAKLKGMINANK